MRQNSTVVARPPFRLPRLPVPDLHQTLERYIKSLVPLLLEKESHGGRSFEAALKSRLEWAREFERGVGQLCQQRLVALDKTSPRNWLDDNIWLKKAYHESRAPLLVHSNWWLAFFNDPTVPDDVLRGYSQSGRVGISPWQIRRGAWLIYRTLEFKDKLEQQELYPDLSRTGVWLRETASKLFNVSRIPQPRCDTLSIPSLSSPGCRKLLVMVHDWFYAIDVYNTDRTLVTANQIEKRLRKVVEDVDRRTQHGQRAVPVGLLSADDRDRWSENLQHLLSLSPTNESIYNTIKDSVFALSLDHYTYNSNIFSSDLSLTTPEALPTIDSPEEIDCHLHNIRSSFNAHNRWFDKAFTYVVESNTRAGAMGEHSPCDALVPSIVAEYAIVESIDQTAFDHPDPTTQILDLDEQIGWQRLDWVTDARVETECAHAEARARNIITDSDDSVLWFGEYGADWIKDTARFSPDAYVQMALQLAWYKTRGTFTATYETVLTRMFDRGRTETIRALTADSRAWVIAMVDPSTSLQQRLVLLRRAIQTHVALTRKAATGKGIDRHLLGLRLMLRPEDGERSDLFEDELFQESQTWKLSTSGLSAGYLFRGTGFGAPYNDGYGINYLSGPDLIKFGIESKHSSLRTSTAQFKRAVVDALREMRMVCLEGESIVDHPPLAHL
ncbi:hypothetical protein EW146_g7127 [Bondarzewia mesenterica]|uniref:Choline/carnitine acyltransferase domain-containing protein n=1 Tax=Bondarzewia mesenterica TaxID=1095465 RepID=A0A4S4LSB6_9AGAM|nr:hypothetical protein EW146_g7127 [Bondarzewia mesenterica]